MQLVATAEQMQKFDRAAIKGLSIPGLVLMENAGRAFVDALQGHTGSLESRSVTVVCGKGNNGGDGFVIARHAANRGARVEVLLLAKPSEIRGDAAENLAAIRRMAARKESGVRLTSTLTPRSIKNRRPGPLVVDAVFGTGFTGVPRGVFKAAIEWINGSRGYVAAVDIPSGVNGNTGEVASVAVRANLTVTMGLAKIGHYTGAGRECTGDLVIAEISIPQFLFKPRAQQTFRVVSRDVRSALPDRPLTAHKYSVGKVLVVGGSRSFTGAPYMTALAALKSGAGAVVLGLPESIHALMARKLTEVILLPLPETPEGTLSAEGIDQILARVSWADAVAVGPGLGRNAVTDGFVLRILPRIDKPLVVDADALNALAGDIRVVGKRRMPTILTPHTGELARLTGWRGDRIDSDRVLASRKAAERLRSILLLKGAPTVTSIPHGPSYINSTGNSGMATIGSGDVLTGLIAGLCAQGMPAAEAAWAGAHIHGRAGDLAASQLGERSLLAMDILDRLPDALKEYDENEGKF
jgi:ADP-dependent NAD(P)H-hydrate dehydratase / NAD(P)H-hydrate epimerase